ncbi:SgrR family transcriptional regulator [Cytobacillus suaedae]|nr:SgrR family transcriptional regulator [Cytobacillus suaedae]
MKLIEYYIRLLMTLADGEVFRSIKMTRPQVSQVLDCTERNAILVLAKMEENQWIEREVGRGRGNVSTITFLKTVDEMLEEYDKVELTQTDIETIIHILNGNESLVQSFLSRLFGVKNSGGLSEIEYLRIPYFRSLYSLIPTDALRQTERHLVQQLFNTLVIYNEEMKKVEPYLSHYWERDESAKAWTFYLRKGVLFHNGKYLEAEDVAFTFQQMKTSTTQWMVRHLESVQCIGKHVITFYFTESVYNWDLLVCSSSCSIVPLNYGDLANEEFARTPIGTGPFKIKEHVPNRLHLSVHQEYFQERAHLDEIILMVLPSIEKFLNVYEMEQEPLAYLPFITENTREKDYQSIERTNISVKFLCWNGKKREGRQNEWLREKIASLITKEKMVQDLGYPRYEPGYSFLNNKQNTMVSSENAVRQEPLLLMTYQLPPNIEDCHWIQKECEKHGIKVELEVVTYDRFLTESTRADFVLTEYVREEAEEVGLLNLFYSEKSTIRTMIPEMNRDKSYIDRILSTEDKVERYRLLEQLENEYIESRMILPLYSTYQKAVHHEKLLGTSLNTVGFVHFKDLFYRKV